MIVLLSTVGIFNYVVDNAGVFSKNNELKEVALALINDKMIAGLENYDERQLQKQIIEESKDKFNIIFLGSSRGMQLRHSFFKFEGETQKFFNHGMSGSSIEDYIAIIGLYESKGYVPSKVVIGVDPWIFNKNNEQTRWKSIGVYYKQVLGAIYGTEVNIDLSNRSKYLQLINLDYTIRDLKFIAKKDYKKKYYTTETINIDDSIREPDGSVHYPFSVRFQKDYVTQKTAKSYANTPVYSLENFNDLSNTKLFEDFIAFLQNKKIEIMFILPPYHPITYKLLVANPKYKIIVDAEKYLKNIADKRGIKISGSYNPDIYELSSLDFTDGMHSKDIVMKKYAENLGKISK
ncbi:MAG: hypothetical protein BWY47_01305 [Bacteroidetes bacterium ADurb.Bin302]|nr:MAG: hypothetical protein BWY47_01305 [Bacteroidetes bacterium ADurb.Bin302]